MVIELRLLLRVSGDHSEEPTEMGCTCSKVQDEAGITRCRKRKSMVKSALRWRNKYAAAHSEYILALMNMGVAIRHFTDGEFRDQLNLSSSSTSSSTSTPIPRTPTTPTPPSSLEEEIVSRVKLPPMALLSNPPAPVTVVVSPPRTPKGTVKTREQEEDYRRYLEADAPPDGLYDFIKQPSESSSSYPYSSYTSSYTPSNSYTPDTSSSQYPAYPSSPPSWDIFGIFQVPPVMDFYHGPMDSHAREEERDLEKVLEDEGIPALETDSPERHAHREEENVKPREEVHKQQQEQKEEKQEEFHVEDEGDSDEVPLAGPEAVMGDKKHPVVEEEEEEAGGGGEEAEPLEPLETSVKDVPSSSGVAHEKVEIVEEGKVRPKGEEATTFSPPSKDLEVWQVLRVIEEQFQMASKMGKDVSRMLEARRAHVNSDSGGLSKRSARILRAMSRSSQWSSPRTPLSSNMSEDSSSDDFGMTREEGGHGGTLDRLYAWEKRLYTEVKDNDQINVQLERKYKQLKKLDGKGAKSELVDKVSVAIKMLENQMQVSMQAMKATSESIQKLTDQELYPQLLELLEGSLIMWKNMSLCHEKQRETVARVKQGGRIPLEATSNSHKQATSQLENALNDWHKSLESLTTKHREYMGNLSSWLRLSTYTPEKKLERPPLVLKLCMEWAGEFDKLPNAEVVAAIKEFSEAIHNIVRLQEEEGRTQKRAESSAKELSKRAQALHNLEKKMEKLETSEQDREGAKASLDEKRAALEVLKIRVEQEKENFTRAMQLTRKTTLETLETGLEPLVCRFADYVGRCSRSYVELQNRVRSGE